MMRRHLPWLLAISLVANIYLAGIYFFNTSTTTGDTSQKTLVEETEQLHNRIKEYEQKTEHLRQQIQTLQERLHGLQSLADPVYQASNELATEEIYSWYFMRKEDNKPPSTEPQYLQMIKDGKGYFLGDTSEKKVYLTFDEGYEQGYTSQILDILKANKVPAAFFVTGSYVKNSPDLVKRMVKEGHIVGNHSNTHPSMPSLSDEQIKQELQTVEDQVKELTGKEMSYFRPPRGEFNQRVLDVAQQEGYTTIFWSMAYRDWLIDNQPGKEAAFNYVVNNIHNGALILLHAVSSSNTEALDDILKEIKKRGYTFASLDELA